MDLKNLKDVLRTLGVLAIVCMFSSCSQNEAVPAPSMDEVVPISTAVATLTANNAPMLLSDRPSDGGCWCTEYIVARIVGLANMTSSDLKPAKNYGDATGWLSNHGYSKVSFSTSNLPQNKDVIIMKSGSHGITNSNGHIGFVGSVSTNGNTITINVVGANQNKTPTNIVCGCPNESTMAVNTTSSDAYIEIWRKPNPALACP
jgi:hypothetical protein